MSACPNGAGSGLRGRARQRGPCGRHARARAGRCAAGGLSRPDRASWSGFLRPRPAHAGLGPGAGAPPSRAAGAHRRRRTDAGDANARAPCRAGRPESPLRGTRAHLGRPLSVALWDGAPTAPWPQTHRRQIGAPGITPRSTRARGEETRKKRAWASGRAGNEGGTRAGRGSRRPPPDCETAGDTSKEVLGDARRHGKQSLRHVCVRAANRSNRDARRCTSTLAPERTAT
ncbi:hypothetical protein ERJ75_001720400 [Trypanosoma vivax]|nr:hypothetical protein ERJ75_001720400 [Trypanosoma vivax]